MEKLNLEKNNLKKFGITMAVAFFAICLLILIKHKHIVWPVAIISLAFFLFAFFAPRLLKLVYIYWMKFAFLLGWVNTRLLLVIIFYIVFTPLGLLLRLFKKDLLDMRIEKTKDTYWKLEEEKISAIAGYEHQF